MVRAQRTREPGLDTANDKEHEMSVNVERDRVADE
jgi:hypothetical protein